MMGAQWCALVRRLLDRPTADPARRPVRPCLELLEDRTAPATFTVVSTLDLGAGVGGAGDLRYCITQSNLTPGTNRIQFALASGPQTITLDSQLTITNDVIIDAGSSQITISGGHATRVFQIVPGVSAAIDNLTIANGFTQFGGGIENDGALFLNGCTLTGNEAKGGDGGSSVHANGGAGGGGAGLGGAIYNTGSLDLTDCTLTSNQAVGGNGGSVNGNSAFLPVDGQPGGDAAGGAGGTGSTTSAPGQNGAAGGFGGGGGGGGGTDGANDVPPSGAGGPGGFGAGGGGGGASPFAFGSAAGGAGGLFGGTGARASFSWAGGGGGGAGLGGALFNNSDAAVSLTNCTLSGNTATGGAAGSSFTPGTAGQGVGGDVFNNEGTVSFVVINTNDSGPGSLPQAIFDANAAANFGTDNILFAIGSGAQTIHLASALPTITNTVNILGTTQPGWSGAPLIALDGGGGSFDGLDLAAGAGNSIIRGLAIDRFQTGIRLDGADGVRIEANYIGVDPTGAAAGNSGDGLLLTNGASGDTVGGTTPGAGNRIAFNAKGVVVTGASSVGNSVLGDSIFSNAGPGIDLGDDGPTPSGAAGPGPNDFQNRPVLTSVSGGTVAGYLTGAANTSYRIEFFATPLGGGPFEGQTFLGFENVVADGSGLATIQAAVTAPPGSVVTATATNLSNGDTSEFSPGPPVSVAVAGGSGQETQVTTPFESQLAVVVRDAFGNAVPGVTVTFAAPASGPTATFPGGASAVTDAAGVARITADAGAVAGGYTVTATVGQVGSVTFTLTNDPGPAATLVVEAPAQIDERDAFSVTVRVFDAEGNAATGFRGVVHFASNDPGASLPADYAFTAEDAGAHTFTGLRLPTPGDRTLTVTGPELQGSAVVRVSDGPPVVTLDDAVLPVAVGTPLASGGHFTDPDGVRWTATVDYGDGSGPQPLALAADKTFRLSHVYTSEGNFTVTVVVTDESGVSSAPASLHVEAFIVGTFAPGVGVAQAAPGSVVVASAPGIVGVLARSAGDVGDGFLLVTPLPVLSAATATDSSPAALFYDARGVNLTGEDVVIVKFTFPPGGVAPVLRFFDRAAGVFRTVPTVVDLADHTVTAVFSRDTTPSVTDLIGTVFTVAVTPAADVFRPEAFAPADASALANSSHSAQAGQSALSQFLENVAASAAGLLTVGTVGPGLDAGVGGGGAAAADSQAAQDILGDLPPVTPDKSDSTPTPPPAVVVPSQTTLPDKTPGDKRPPGPDKPRPPAPKGGPEGARAPAPALPGPGAVQRTQGRPLAVDLVLAAGLPFVLPTERLLRRRGRDASGRRRRPAPPAPGGEG